MQNLAHYVLDEIDSNWNTSNYDPKPVLVDKNDAEYHANPPTGYSVGDASVDFDHTDANVVKVGSNITRDGSPMGSAFDLNVEDGVTVTIQAADDSVYGHVADHGEFLSLVGEVRRTVFVNRKWPIRNQSGDEHYHTLVPGQEADNSHRYKDFYEYSLPILLSGYEDLP